MSIRGRPARSGVNVSWTISQPWAEIEAADPGFTERGKFVHAPRAVDHPDAAAAKLAQDFRVDGGQFGGENADELVVGPGRIQQGAQQVEDRADAFGGKLPPHGADGLERRVILRREKESEARRFQAAAQGGGGQVERHTERGEHVGPAAFGGHGAVCRV